MIGQFIPKAVERIDRALSLAFDETIDHDDAVYRPGAGAANAIDVNAGIAHQAMKHTPCERAMRAAALKRKTDALGVGAMPRATRRGFLVRGWFAEF